MRNSPPIHTCSEHAQGPSKPPAVVRKLWCLNVCCFVPDLCESPAKWQLLTQRRGEGGVGGIKVERIRHFRGVAVLRCICWRSQPLGGRFLLILTGSEPPFVGGFCPWLLVRAFWAQRWSVGRHWNIEFCITVILITAKWPWTPSHGPIHMPLCSLAFLSLASDFPFLACFI